MSENTRRNRYNLSEILCLVISVVCFCTFLFCSIWVLACCHVFFWGDDNDSTSGPGQCGFVLIAYFVTVTVRHGLTYWTRASEVPLSGLFGGGRWPIATALQ